MVTPQIATARASATTRALRKLVVVSRNPGERLPDSVMDAADYDVVVIESLAHAYSRIKLVRPNLVVMCLSFDDLEGFHVLSMLHLDTDTARIPLMTYAAEHSDAFRDDSVDVEGETFQQTVPISMN